MMCSHTRSPDIAPTRACVQPDKQAIGQLHDVGLVNRVHLLTAKLAQRIEKAYSAMRVEPFSVMILIDFHDARHDFMFEPDIKVFRVLAHDDQVNAGIAWSRARADS